MWKRVSAAALAVMLVGCSFTMAQNPRNWEPSQEPSCEAGRGNPIGEAIVGGVAVGVAVWMVAERSGCDTRNCRDLTTAFALAWTAVAIPVLLAARVGFRRASRCREAIRLRREWKLEHSGPPGMTAPQPPADRDQAGQ